MRLIDADVLIRRVVAERDSVEIKTGCDIGYHNGLNMAVSMAINAPTVEAVILPCKVGDTVYFADDLFMWPAEIEGIRIRESGVYFEWVQYARSPELTEVWDNGDFNLDDVGKTVFLTREEAEAALAERKMNDA